MKRFVSLLLSMTMFFTFIGGNSFAAVNLIDSEETNTEELSKVVLAVKSKINIPEELTEFDYNYNGETSYSRAGWRFNWRDKDYKKRITISCDTDAHITYYDYYTSDRYTTQAPQYLKEELKPKADDFIKQVAPEVADRIVFKSASNSGRNYIYTYERIENGILMPENTVSVSVNYVTTEVDSIGISWLYDLDIPGVKTSITEQQAKDMLGQKINMKLQYRNRSEKIEPDMKDSKTKTIAYLVYVPDTGYISVDAKTGEIYTTREEWVSKDEFSANKEMLSSGAVNDAMKQEAVLTEEEIAEIDKLKDLISKEEAIKILTSNDKLYIKENLKAVTANLRKSYSGDDEFYWEINLSPMEKGTDNARATIDAKSGKILSFYASMNSYYDEEKEEWKDIKVKYTSKQCKTTLESFIKENIPEYFDDTKLSKEDNGYILRYINEQYVYGGYSYRYNRINEGIEYTYNSINGAVDGVTGKIYSFSYNWTDDIEFESPKNAMSPEKAYVAYVSKEGFNLLYEINNIHIYDEQYEKSNEYYEYSKAYDLENEVRLVYRPDISPAIISPFTGKQLDYDGKEYIKKEEYEYNDIVGHWAEREINLLADIGIGLEEIKFEPDKTVTKVDLEKIYAELYRNIDTQNEEITRMDLIKALIKSLGLNEVAKVQGIYIVDYKDKEVIKTEDIGYAALAKGLNLIKDKEENLKAEDKLTRADLMYSIMRLMEARAKLNNDRLYY